MPVLAMCLCVKSKGYIGKLLKACKHVLTLQVAVTVRTAIFLRIQKVRVKNIDHQFAVVLLLFYITPCLP